jgi:hypothetical protein
MEKFLYKIVIEVIKVLPMILSLNQVIIYAFNYCGYYVPGLSFLGGVSLLTILFLYLVSYVFKFCAYHRMFLHYLVTTNVISVYDYAVGINLLNTNMCLMGLILSGIFLFIILYLHVKGNKKSAT